MSLTRRSGFNNTALAIADGPAFGRELGITAKLASAGKAIDIVSDPKAQLADYKKKVDALQKGAHILYGDAKKDLEKLGFPTETCEMLARNAAMKWLEGYMAILDAAYPLINDNSVLLSAAAGTPIHAAQASGIRKPGRKARR